MPHEPQQEAPPTPEEEKITIDKKTHDRLFAQSRILRGVQGELADLRAKLAQQGVRKEIVEAQVPNADDLDKLAEKDWKAAVRQIVRAESQAVIAEERKRQEESAVITESRQAQEKNAQAVLSKHPELDDPTSEKAQIWQQILSENPRWVQSPDGPLLVMYRMEEVLRGKGYVVDKKPETRRVADTSLRPSRPVAPTGKVVLTREQREFCDNNGISYEEYAKTLRMQETGVSL